MYVADFCVRAILPSYKETYDFLCMGQTLIGSSKGSTPMLTPQYQSLTDTRILLGTFLLVNGSLCKVSETPDDVKFNSFQWQVFRCLDMVSECREYIREGKIQSGVIIWRRHCLGKSPSGG